MNRRLAISWEDLPQAWRAEASAFAPALEQLSSKHPPLDTVKIVVAALLEQLSSKRRPQVGLAAALARGLVMREELKEVEGGSLTAEEARLVLGGLSKEAVLKRYRKGHLLGWREVRQNAVRFPAWQFIHGNVIPGLAEVLLVLGQNGTLDDWGKIGFFLNRRSSLKNERPLDYLRRGDLEPVKRAALAYME